MTGPAALQVTQLTVNYDKISVLWDVSLTVPQGRLVAILGPNGAGKSTFIKAILGLIKPIAGGIEILGQPLKKVRPRVAYVPQRESVDWDFPITVLQLVLMGRYGRLGLLRWPRRADLDAAKHFLELVGMSAYVDRQISQLSGGQQQRVFLARALMQETDIYFMDEPFAGVDAATEKVLISLLQQLRDQGKTIFVVHHDLSTVESYFDWVILLNTRLVSSGPTADALRQDLLERAYAKSRALLSEVARLTQNKTRGLL